MDGEEEEGERTGMNAGGVLSHLVHVLFHLWLDITHSPLREDGPDHPVVGSAMSAVGGKEDHARSASKAVSGRRVRPNVSGVQGGREREEGGGGLPEAFAVARETPQRVEDQ
jgi:hypothetical protein